MQFRWNNSINLVDFDVQEELERRRTERQIYEERVKADRAAERASKPKKLAPKRDNWEVESIKGLRLGILNLQSLLSPIFNRILRVRSVLICFSRVLLKRPSFFYRSYSSQTSNWTQKPIFRIWSCSFNFFSAALSKNRKIIFRRERGRRQEVLPRAVRWVPEEVLGARGQRQG